MREYVSLPSEEYGKILSLNTKKYKRFFQGSKAGKLEGNKKKLDCGEKVSSSINQSGASSSKKLPWPSNFSSFSTNIYFFSSSGFVLHEYKYDQL